MIRLRGDKKGWIGKDQVEAAACDRRKAVSFDDLNVLHTVQTRVEARKCSGARVEIGGHHRVAELCRQKTQYAAARSQIQGRARVPAHCKAVKRSACGIGPKNQFSMLSLDRTGMVRGYKKAVEV